MNASNRSKGFAGTITVGQQYKYFIELSSSFCDKRREWTRVGVITLFDAGHGYIGVKFERVYYDFTDEQIVSNLKSIARGGF